MTLATSSSTTADTELDSPDARALRGALIEELIAEGHVSSPSVIEALRAVPRHLFVPRVSLGRAYVDHALPIGYDQTISQPAVVAAMTEALDLRGHERVLEVGTGSGYQTALLSMLARSVYTIERVAPLALETAARLSRLGYENVHTRCGDGYHGWPEQGPFDRIIITAAPPTVPDALVEQLAEGGLLVAPIGEPGVFSQTLVRARKVHRHLEFEDLGGVSFVEMLHGLSQ